MKPSKTSLITSNGRYVDPLDFKSEDVDINVIAHALANICRFNGQTNEFYSVAQHSVHVAERVSQLTDNKEIVLLALFHDASEAYICDIPRPLKHSDLLEGYLDVETAIQETINEVLVPEIGPSRLSFDTARSIISRADLDLMGLEARQLGTNWKIEEWDIPLPSFNRLISPLAPRAAERFFHNFHNELRYGI